MNTQGLNNRIAELKGWTNIKFVEWSIGSNGHHSREMAWGGKPPNSHETSYSEIPHYTSDLNVAIGLLEEIDGKLAWDVTRWEIVARPEGLEDWPVIYARNAAIGICQAWLRMHGLSISDLLRDDSTP